TPGQLYKEKLKAEREALLLQSVPIEQRKSKKKILTLMLLMLFFIGGSGIFGIIFLRGENVEVPSADMGDQRIVLSDTVSMTFRVATQAIFDRTVQFADTVTFENAAIFNQGLSLNNQDLNLGQDPFSLRIFLLFFL